MSRRRPRRRAPDDVLVRGPWLVSMPRRCPPLIDAVDQLEELASLFSRGLLSRAEFERQKRRVLDD